MDLEIFILSQPDRERQILYNIAYMWSLKKNGINEFVYKPEVESRMKKTNLQLSGDEGD